MAKKSNRQTDNSSQSMARPQAAQQKAAAPAGGGDSFIKKYKHLLIPAGIALAVWVCYMACLDNQLTNWDDPGYIKDNALIKDLSGGGLSNIFTTSIMGNYHPLTILSYAIEYSFVRLQPWLYHLDSVLFHIIVTLLVYWFVKLLTRRPVAAGVTALLFGLHPMHVESVAWLAGRKDVVYGMFYMMALIAHVYYIRAEGSSKAKWYVGVLLLFLCSLLSKPVAVVLPVTLLLVDYFEQRKLSYRLLLDKVPHFLIAIGFGVRSMLDQRAFGSLDTHDISFNGVERVALGGYAFVTYLWKAVVPVSLSNFYPYPDKVAGGMIAWQYFLYPAAVVALLAAVWYFARRNRAIIFGTLFFLVNIVLLLQFIPVGGAIIADRYSYIPYLGLFFMAGWGIALCFEDGGRRQVGQAALAVVLAYSAWLGYLANERCKVWYDTTSLWRDEIEKEPVRAPNAWNNLGFNYFNKFNDTPDPALRKIYYDSAYFLLSRAIELQPAFVNPYISLGELERSVNNFPAAKAHYYKALSIGHADECANAYLGLAIIYAIAHNFDSSGISFRKALEAKPYFPEAHSNFGNYFDMMHQPDSALAQYAIAISQNPDMFAPHLNRGRLLQRLHRCPESIKDYEIALQLNPDNGEIYYARSMCHAQNGDKAKAVQDIDKAISLGFRNVDPKYYEAMKAR